jgi:hypothetical protein
MSQNTTPRAPPESTEKGVRSQGPRLGTPPELAPTKTAQYSSHACQETGSIPLSAAAKYCRKGSLTRTEVTRCGTSAPPGPQRGTDRCCQVLDHGHGYAYSAQTKGHQASSVATRVVVVAAVMWWDQWRRLHRQHHHHHTSNASPRSQPYLSNLSTHTREPSLVRHE